MSQLLISFRGRAIVETGTISADTERIVLLGASMGGIMGALLTAADKRIDAAALLIAGANFRLLAESSLDEVHPLRDALSRATSEASERILGDVDPAKWVGSISPRPLLFVNGTRDTVIPKASAEALINAAKQPKPVIWDDVGHTVSPLKLMEIYGWIVANTPAKS